MKEVTLQMTVRVDDSVEDNAVAQQIEDAIDPDGWNWDVSYPWVTASKPVSEPHPYCTWHDQPLDWCRHAPEPVYISHPVGHCPICGLPILDNGHDDNPEHWEHSWASRVH